ncbi:unnamed protein product [Rhizophagus irregularis]|uniref:Uncharacterized protein n=1 Tax=Rhizophagus irregularis TaxID=588596 RepID=A0A916EDS5_9GLOM|nr:unnamed protein product [Rhizophagus irregularis]CAB5197545.1 unnamed protein product [Rhizophagus irregularis]CAB5383154.1 unnamed protein product [Rhizophagus irregularis]
MSFTNPVITIRKKLSFIINITKTLDTLFGCPLQSLFPNTRARPFSLENDKQTIFSISSIPTSMFSISVFLYFTKGVHSRINKIDPKSIRNLIINWFECEGQFNRLDAPFMSTATILPS